MVCCGGTHVNTVGVVGCCHSSPGPGATKELAGNLHRQPTFAVSLGRKVEQALPACYAVSTRPWSSASGILATSCPSGGIAEPVVTHALGSNSTASQSRHHGCRDFTSTARGKHILGHPRTGCHRVPVPASTGWRQGGSVVGVPRHEGLPREWQGRTATDPGDVQDEVECCTTLQLQGLGWRCRLPVVRQQRMARRGGPRQNGHHELGPQHLHVSVRKGAGSVELEARVGGTTLLHEAAPALGLGARHNPDRHHVLVQRQVCQPLPPELVRLVLRQKLDVPADHLYLHRGGYGPGGVQCVSCENGVPILRLLHNATRDCSCRSRRGLTRTIRMTTTGCWGSPDTGAIRNVSRLQQLVGQLALDGVSDGGTGEAVREAVGEGLMGVLQQRQGGGGDTVLLAHTVDTAGEEVLHGTAAGAGVLSAGGVLLHVKVGVQQQWKELCEVRALLAKVPAHVDQTACKHAEPQMRL